jgi:hypothetical protein
MRKACLDAFWLVEREGIIKGMLVRHQVIDLSREQSVWPSFVGSQVGDRVSGLTCVLCFGDWA